MILINRIKKIIKNKTSISINRRGFMMVEILVAISIITVSILATMVEILFQNQRRKPERNRAKKATIFLVLCQILKSFPHSV